VVRMIDFVAVCNIESSRNLLATLEDRIFNLSTINLLI
jgi:hypothetical protein